MQPQAVLTAFDQQIRRQPEGPDGSAASGGAVERDGNVVRSVPSGDGWTGVTWTDLNPDGSDADAVIAAQIRRFGQLSRPWEWKHYSYDQPPDLADRLRAAGLTAEPTETLLVAEIAELSLDVPPPPGVTLHEIVDEPGVEAMVSVHNAVFGDDHSAVGRSVLAALAQRPVSTVAVLARAGQEPISSGRLEFHLGTEFASLWGGGTLPAWRGRGVFRALVAHRAALAAARGFRYLQVDATADSRPILRRLGFVELATTTPFAHPG
jgi:GNAT superfamily N-acetyltransferase